MAYKFQVGSAILSGSLTQEGNVEIQNDAGGVVGIFDNTGVLSASAGATAASFSADGALTGGSLVVGAADMSEADLEKLDGITNGAGAANKALVLNASSVIASGLVGLTASSGIKAGELEATGHVLAPALISTTTIQGAAISGSGDLNANRLVIGGPNFGAGLAKIDDLGAGTFASIVSNGLVNVTGQVSASDVLSANGAKLSGSLVGTSADFAGSVTAGTSFVIGSADLNETDLEKLDGITNGTGAAAKALVLDADSKITAGLASITASADLKAARIEATAKVIVGSDLEVGALFKMPDVTSGKILVADGTSFQEVAMSGDVAIDNAGATTIQANAVECSMINSNAAGDGLKYDSNTLALDLNELAAGAINQAADSIAFIDADGNGSKKESVVDFVAAIAGAGLSAGSGQLSVQGNTVTIATDGVTLTEGYNYFTGSVDADCELPSGSVGDVVTVKAGNTAVGASIVINRSGSGGGVDTIDGASSILLESPFAAVTMVYVRPGEWKIV